MHIVVPVTNRLELLYPEVPLPLCVWDKKLVGGVISNNASGLSNRGWKSRLESHIQQVRRNFLTHEDQLFGDSVGGLIVQQKSSEMTCRLEASIQQFSRLLSKGSAGESVIQQTWLRNMPTGGLVSCRSRATTCQPEA